MHKLTKAAIWSRGMLYAAIAGFSFLQGSKEFRDMVADQVEVGIGFLLAVLIAVRLFIDQSVSQGDNKPVPVTNAKGDALDVTPKKETKESNA